jgi:hypothetical protein
MSQFPIIIKPSLLEQALTATPKPEPYQPPVIPSPGAKPKRFKTGLLVAQAVVFTIIALVPAFFGEFILAAVLLAATVGVILAQVNNQRVEYLRKLRISEEGSAIQVIVCYYKITTNDTLGCQRSPCR